MRQNNTGKYIIISTTRIYAGLNDLINRIRYRKKLKIASYIFRTRPITFEKVPESP
jgi:hypothetical protein